MLMQELHEGLNDEIYKHQKRLGFGCFAVSAIIGSMYAGHISNQRLRGVWNLVALTCVVVLTTYLIIPSGKKGMAASHLKSVFFDQSGLRG